MPAPLLTLPPSRSVDFSTTPTGSNFRYTWTSAQATGMGFDVGTGEFTLEMWIYQLSYGGGGTFEEIMGKTNNLGNTGFDIENDNNGSTGYQMYFAGGGPASLPSAARLSGTWMYNAFTRRGTGIDGWYSVGPNGSGGLIKAAALTTSSANITSTQILDIGAQSAFGQGARARIAVVRWWNRSLTDGDFKFYWNRRLRRGVRYQGLTFMFDPTQDDIHSAATSGIGARNLVGGEVGTTGSGAVVLRSDGPPLIWDFGPDTFADVLARPSPVIYPMAPFIRISPPAAGGTTSTRTVPTSLVVSSTSTRTVPTSLVAMATLTRTVPTSLVALATATRTVPTSLVTLQSSTRTVPTSLVTLATLTRTVPTSLVATATLTRTVPTSLVALATLTRTVPTSLVVYQTPTRTVPTSLVSLQTSTRTVPTSLVTAGSPLRTVPTSLVVLATLTRTVPTSLVALATFTRTVPTSLVTLATATRTVPTSLVALATLTRTVPTSLVVTGGALIRTVPTSLVVLATLTRTVPTSLVALQPNITRTVPTSLVTYQTKTRTVPTSLVSLQTSTRTVPSSLVSKATLTCLVATALVLKAVNIARTVPTSLVVVPFGFIKPGTVGGGDGPSNSVGGIDVRVYSPERDSGSGSVGGKDGP